MRFTYTGGGLVALWFVIVAAPTSVAAGLVTSDFRTSVALIVGGLCFALLTVPYTLMAIAMNSTRTQQGRVWHNRHTLNDAPIQSIGGVFLLASGISVVAGLCMLSWIAVVGTVIAVPVLVIVVGAVVSGFRMTARQRKVMGERSQLATSRGWMFRRTDVSLAERLKAAHGKAALWAPPFGVVAGEIDGLPFTAFDTEFDTVGPEGETSMRMRRTMWMVHLPVTLPDVEVFIAAHADGRQRWSLKPKKTPGTIWEELRGPIDATRLRAVAADPIYANALLTPEVRRLTDRYRFDTWQIVGRDLIRTSEHYGDVAHVTPEALAAEAEHVVELARALPRSVLSSYGTTPKTGVPFRESAGATTG